MRNHFHLIMEDVRSGSESHAEKAAWKESRTEKIRNGTAKDRISGAEAERPETRCKREAWMFSLGQSLKRN
jgi:hypothetical protein